MTCVRWAVLARIAAAIGGLAAVVLIVVALIGGLDRTVVVVGVVCACCELLAGVLTVAGWVGERRSAAAAGHR